MNTATWSRSTALMVRNTFSGLLRPLSSALFNCFLLVVPSFSSFFYRSLISVFQLQHLHPVDHVRSCLTSFTFLTDLNQRVLSTLYVLVMKIRCQQDDAPNIVVSTCNGFYCDNWLDGHFQNKPGQPGAWTENWYAFQRCLQLISWLFIPALFVVCFIVPQAGLVPELGQPGAAPSDRGHLLLGGALGGSRRHPVQLLHVPRWHQLCAHFWYASVIW